MVSRRRMVPWSLILILLITAVTIHHVNAQQDPNGFLSIDCGLPNVPFIPNFYTDNTTKLTYTTDDFYIKTGSITNISSSNSSDSLAKEFLTLRYFPAEFQNCYTLNSTVGMKYLIRATFYYGNYDNLNKPPTFDIYVDFNFWTTVNASTFSFPEIIFVATQNVLKVCLANNGGGIPFISSLHLRPLLTDMYAYGNLTTAMILAYRLNFGGTSFLRYPEDNFDRWWWNYTESGWKEISYNRSNIDLDDAFRVPPAVLQTAVTSSSIQQPLSLFWSGDYSTRYYFVLHFYDTNTTGRREFNITVNGLTSFGKPIIIDNTYWTFHWRSGYTNYNVTLVATSNSTLPPLLNAFELYTVVPVGVSTYDQDVDAINGVRDHYRIQNWSGDPCLPTQFLWSGIKCTIGSSNTTRITSLNLSSSLLTGRLIDSFGNLTALEYLYLSNNKLSGSLPSSLDNLTSLKFLDITGNPDISTTLPLGLNKKLQDGSLDYKFGPQNSSTSPPSPSTNPPPALPKKTVITITIAVVVPLLVTIVAIATVLRLKRKYYGNYAEGIWEIGPEQNFPKFEGRQFSYNDLKKITNNFEKKIGTGGFGSVYLGILEDGGAVAVKMHSHLSAQGVKELLAEAESLTRVHHKYLVALMGYCIDKSCMALVYEYMSEGNLYEKLQDNEKPVSWRQRIQIAYESALGLEYLHKACNPPLIHRDVKTSNILLTASLQAKIADFGLSRAFNNSAISHVSTRVVGTPGYLDPEYYQSTGQLTIKSDVYSFGVVLLEIITGRPPIMVDVEGTNLVQWVRQKLSAGGIESIVDSKMQGKYGINSVLKVINLACKCTELKTSERPTMTEVAAELKESLDLEISIEEMERKSIENLMITNVSQNSSFEIACVGDIGQRQVSTR